jgi:uncharacterized membrane protein
MAMHSGPLPPPGQLADYEAVYPGAAEWIIKEAERNAAHVRDMERQGIRAQRIDMLLFRLLPFALVAAFLLASVIIAVFVNPYIGGAAVVATMGGVLTAYLTGHPPTTGGE